MKMMKEQPILTLGVATAALAILLLALGSFTKSSGPQPDVEESGPASMVVLIEGDLQPGMEVYVMGGDGSGMVPVGRVVGVSEALESVRKVSDERTWPVRVDHLEDQSF